ncbi:uncharacterized protein LOC133780010 [Humulus lupulus]|uniref:uncharacterized protein LOC133780010 n=1 Tax=Humulus lupulus TaxID=3486 RepID=UPI002B40A919|nr:uncharacterized protein LOC133780010 [Humulus lupulus]
MRKSANEAYDLLEEMAINNQQWPSERGNSKKVSGLHEIDAISKLTAQVEALTKQLQGSTMAAPMMQVHTMCELCGGPHTYEKCQYVDQPQQSFQQPPQGFYQQRFRPQQQPPQPPMQQQQNPVRQPDTQSNVLNQFMIETQSSIRNLETQIGQLATLMASRAQGDLPSTTEAQGTLDQKQDEDKVTEDLPIKEATPPVSIDHHIKIPYPQRLRKNNLDKQFSKFLEVFKKLHINIPFAEALEQMPSYVKFMKDILSKKRKIKEYEMVALTEECSAILQRKLPQKLRDPGNFTIPCTIGNIESVNALCDLGASINLMPLSVFKRLKLGEARPTTLTLQLADRSLAHPRGIIEDVLVKVDKFIFPANFIILDMEEDTNIPFIHGRPFLATGQALIDV